MSEVALIILFNHNYEQNLAKLDEIYGIRFSNLWYIMPFYNGDRKDVISVYENSYYFQGYIAYALSRLKEKGYKYYFIIADDLYLNPIIDENNYKEFFKVDEDTAFIPGPFLLNDLKEIRPSRPYAPFWSGLENALNFTTVQKGISSDLLPSNEEAIKLLKRHNIYFTSKLPSNIFFSNPLIKLSDTYKENWIRIRIFIKSLKNILFNRGISYPLIGSYSDILILPNKYEEKFIKYCGAFAALNLFVEIALPTALAFACPKIISEDDLVFKGETYWHYNHSLGDEKYNRSIRNLNESFPERCLYIHPIKISKWD